MKFKNLFFLIITLLSLHSYSIEIVKVSSDVNFPPFNYYNEKGEYIGIDLEIVEAVFSKMNVKTIHFPRPWKRALLDFNSKETDALFQLTPTKERFANWSMVGPIRNNNSAYYVKAESKIKDIKDYSELKGLPVGLQVAYTYPKEFDNASGFEKERASSSKINIRKLLRKRIDIVVESETVFDYEIRKNGLINKIRKLPSYAVESSRYIAFHKDERGVRLAKEFQKNLDILIADGTVDYIIKNWKEK